MSNKFPSLDQYAPPSQPSAPPVNFGNQDFASYPNTNANNYPSHSNPNVYTPTHNIPPPVGQYDGGQSYNNNNNNNNNKAGGAQPALFQDMGFLQDAVYSQVSSRILDNGKQYVDKNFGRFMTISPLKYYFNVNNRYVFNKLALLFFPFIHKNWGRARSAHSDLHEAVPPREDINAPDLYIPVMSFVTYILLVGFIHGTVLKFTPEVLGITATTGLVILALEICFIKFSFYLLNARSVPFLDLLSYCGYIFFGLIVSSILDFVFNILLGVSFVPWGIYPGLCLAYFLFRVLGAAAPDMTSVPKIRTYLLIVAALQVLVVFYLNPTRVQN